MFSLRPMEKSDWSEVAGLIYLSTNHWYETKQGHPAFSGGPQVCLLFCQVYEDLDPGCCLIAEHNETGAIMASCFYHPRETHVSLGIMNVHPNFFGAGVASALLNEIIDFTKAREMSLRLVSSALNLDSYSLYNRKGFVATAIYQDMLLEIPENGVDSSNFDLSCIRNADLEDVSAMGALEFEISGISRERDYCYFIENDQAIWHVSISEDKNGAIDGYLVSVSHPCMTMIGPGVARDSKVAGNLIVNELNQHKGKTTVVLIPAENRELVDAMYSIGARNCELHFSQVLGEQQPINGVVMPTFMPETG